MYRIMLISCANVKITNARTSVHVVYVIKILFDLFIVRINFFIDTFLINFLIQYFLTDYDLSRLIYKLKNMPPDTHNLTTYDEIQDGNRYVKRKLDPLKD